MNKRLMLPGFFLIAVMVGLLFCANHSQAVAVFTYPDNFGLEKETPRFGL